MASNITEGLVARGWDVTLFATGDSLTRAKLHAVVDVGYEEDAAADPKVAEYLHIAEVFDMLPSSRRPPRQVSSGYHKAHGFALSSSRH